jgi:hypothetical protein
MYLSPRVSTARYKYHSFHEGTEGTFAVYYTFERLLLGAQHNQDYSTITSSILLGDTPTYPSTLPLLYTVVNLLEEPHPAF